MAGRRKRLTDDAVERLRPRGKEYAVWDDRAPGLGVRVRPTGGKSYVMLGDAGNGSRRLTLGPVSTMDIAEARRECLARQALHEPGRKFTPKRVAPSLRQFVEGDWKKAHFEQYKPSTRKGFRYMLENRILPTFGSKPLDRIDPTRIGRWFDAYSRTAPGGANHALSLLRQIMNFALARGHIEKNPAQGIRPNHRPRLTRFLSREEIDRLYRVLDMESGKGAVDRADIVRLLLLTGCRKGEIVRLRWSEVHSDALLIADGKTGARRVPLNSQARRILERRLRGTSPFVFPSPIDPSRPRNHNLSFWHRVRRQAGIEDCRLHDLRHSYASHAVMRGVPLPVVSRLLGHASVTMTLRYAHLRDRDIEEAAERVGQAIASILDN